MRLPILALLLFAAAMALTDVSIYKQLRKLGHRWLTTAHIAVSAIIYIVLAVIAAFAKSQAGEEFFIMMMWGLFSAISVSAAKLIYMPFYAISMLPRLRQSRAMRKWRIAGIAIGAAVLLTMWWGAIVTPRQLEVNNVTITSANLPAAFDGYRILQVSDLHTGTYGNRTSIVESIVKEINAQHADLVVVTGDIVNRKADEINPFIPTLRQIKAKDGVISILGNHDYGDYYKWSSAADKKANLDRLISIQRDSLGWTLLLNEHIFLRQGGDSIAVIGVENWGEPPFPTYGDLGKAYPDVNDSRFKLLLTHNPKHWESIVSKQSNIDLTLSGHTHAMQMMLSVAGIKLSPSVWKYQHWQGLSNEDGKMLYVNIGTGEVGIPMRIGATPEITVFTLKRK